MTPRQLREAFDACSLDPETFHHEQHVAVAWTYLQDFPLAQALERFSSALLRFATSAGAPQKYHETITWAFLIVLNERMQQMPDASWEQFAAANPDLMQWPASLDRYYSAGVLASDLAKRTFVLPRSWES